MINMEKRYLTVEQLGEAARIVVEEFDREIKRLGHGYSEAYLTKISSAFIDEYHKVKLAAFFTLQSLEKKVDCYFSDEAPRDFVLNLTQAVATRWAVHELGYDTLFINTIARGVMMNKPLPDRNYSLMNTQVIQSLYVQEDTLVQLLTDNPWLVVLYLLMQHMDTSAIYRAIIKKTD